MARDMSTSSVEDERNFIDDVEDEPMSASSFQHPGVACRFERLLEPQHSQ